MLIGVFELLVAKQQEYDAYAGYLDAVRDYWTARTELARAVGRQLPSSDQPAEPTLDPGELTKPKRGSMDHSGHAMGGMKGMDHSGHHMQNEGTEMEDMPGMQGMDHGTHGAASEPEPGQDEQPAEEKPAHGHQHD